jgi:Tol biopolymer transport system component
VGSNRRAHRVPQQAGRNPTALHDEPGWLERREHIEGGQADSPAWAPDGSRIAFTSDRTGNPEIYSATPDGSTVTPLTSLGVTSTGNASWAPDGSRIAFESLGRIYLMNADGTNAMPISAGAIRGDHSPTWKPDGSKIAFSRGLTFEDHDIFVMNPDGSSALDVTETTSTTTFERRASWPPDGTHLVGEISEAQTGQPTSGTGIYVVDAAGTRFDNIVLPQAFRPCWSPDGASLIYDSDRNGNSELHAVPRAGGSSVNLTNSAGHDTQCARRPR